MRTGIALRLLGSLALVLSSTAWSPAQTLRIVDPAQNASPATSGAIAVPQTVTSGDAAPGDLHGVLSHGDHLRRERRWSDLIRHYEAALKSRSAAHNAQTIQQRLTWARAHQDVARRSSDASYRQSVSSLTSRQAIDIYSEVLDKVESHYVKMPSWRALVQQGAITIQAALLDPPVAKQLAPAATRSQIDAFCQELERLLRGRSIDDANEARAAAWYGAQLASHRLGVNPTAGILEFAAGAVGTLDPYSTFLTPAQLSEVMDQIEGNFVGLGIELESEPQALHIVNVIHGGPAFEAGLLSGDRITSVDGTSVAELTAETAANRLRGEENSAVSVGIARDGRPPQVFRIVRRVVEVPSVINIGMLDPRRGIGYLKITSFQKTTMRDVESALWSLHRQGMKHLVIDVRGNPGGLLNASVDLADKFLTDGRSIVSTRGRTESFDFKAREFGTWRIPLIVLIDGDSASASEIFAGAISDNGRGTLIGERSYGKGSVQGIFRLRGFRAGVRLTTSKFYSPSGRQISNNGVEPHVVVHTTAKPTRNLQAAHADPALKAAMQAVEQGQFSQR